MNATQNLVARVGFLYNILCFFRLYFRKKNDKVFSLINPSFGLLRRNAIHQTTLSLTRGTYEFTHTVQSY